MKWQPGNVADKVCISEYACAKVGQARSGHCYELWLAKAWLNSTVRLRIIIPSGSSRSIESLGILLLASFKANASTALMFSAAVNVFVIRNDVRAARAANNPRTW